MRESKFGRRPRGREELAAWYGAMLRDQVESGLSLKAYADQAGLSAWTLYDWRRRLGQARRLGRAAGSRRKEKPRLVEVSIAPPAASTGQGLVVRVCDGRRSVVVPSGFDGDELRRVITVLESC